MLIWRGWGILVPLLAGFTAFLVKLIIDKLEGPGTYEAQRELYTGISWGVSAVVLLLVGLALNGGGEVQYDPTTGQYVKVKRSRHSFFFIPVEYWSIVSLILAAIAFTSRRG
jgi:hypothetical protein